MNTFPDEYELLSFFECEPEKTDIDVPFYYNQMSYTIKDDLNEYEFQISPAYGDLSVFWKEKGKLVLQWNFHNIEKLQIEKNNNSEYLILSFRSEDLSDCLIWVRPKFKMIGGMNINT